MEKHPEEKIKRTIIMSGTSMLGAIHQALEGASEAHRHSGKTGVAEAAKSAAKVPLYAYLSLTAGAFEFMGKKHAYFYHAYNNTRQNERCVEVPIAYDEVLAAGGNAVLEVGNVLSHYYKFQHDVVDKYEKAEGVQNDDIVDFAPGKKYGLIVSISTLEHVGFDETPRDDGKVLRALSKLRELLAQDGKCIVTFGLGHNPNIDALALSAKPEFVEWHFMRRDAKNNWAECPKDDAVGAKYGSPYPAANFLAIGVMRP